MAEFSEVDRNKLVEAQAALKLARRRLREGAAEIAHAEQLFAELTEEPLLRSQLGVEWECGMLHAHQQAITALRSQLNSLAARIRGWL